MRRLLRCATPRLVVRATAIDQHRGDRCVKANRPLDVLATRAVANLRLPLLRLRRPASEMAAGDDAPSDSSERLIPFVGAFIDDVNLADKRISVDWGLDY